MSVPENGRASSVASTASNSIRFRRTPISFSGRFGRGAGMTCRRGSIPTRRRSGSLTSRTSGWFFCWTSGGGNDFRLWCGISNPLNHFLRVFVSKVAAGLHGEGSAVFVTKKPCDGGNVNPCFNAGCCKKVPEVVMGQAVNSSFFRGAVETLLGFKNPRDSSRWLNRRLLLLHFEQKRGEFRHHGHSPRIAIFCHPQPDLIPGKVHVRRMQLRSEPQNPERTSTYRASRCAWRSSTLWSCASRTLPGKAHVPG